MGENPSDYYVLVGTACSTQQLLKACDNETVSIFTKYGDISDASIAVLEGEEYVPMETELSLRCALRLRAPFLAQQSLCGGNDVAHPTPPRERVRST